jgi:plasmid stabilization system protein ParE
VTRAVVFRRAARREFDEAALWYDARVAGLGAGFVAAINRAVQLAAEHPERYAVLHRDVRCIRVGRFPYSIVLMIAASWCWPCFMRAAIR